jgi:hypothetical protein
VKFVAVSGIADKDGNLIPMGEEFEDSRLTKETKAKFIKLGAIRKPEEIGADDEYVDIFEPLSLEETAGRMNEFDFSERVMRSASFHGDALKEEILRQQKGGKSSSSSKTSAKTGNESDALTLENLNKMDTKALAELAKTKNLAVDPRAKVEELAQLIYDHDLVNTK